MQQRLQSLVMILDSAVRQYAKISLKNQVSFCSSSTFSASTTYNHGLSGQAKYKKSIVKNLPQVKGEVLYGLHSVLLALKSKKREHVHCIFIDEKFKNEGFNHKVKSQILELATLSNAPVCVVKLDVLHQLSGNRPHQGVCMDVSALKTSEWNEQHTLTWTSHLPFWLLLHNIQDPMNFGAVLRSAHYLGLDKIVFPSTFSCSLSCVVSKASAGAMEVADLLNIPVTSSEIAFCNWWHSQGGQVLGTGASSDERSFSLTQFEMTKPTLLVLGNEGFGLSKELEDLCDRMITIPGNSSYIDSLNVSVAAGILMHWIKSHSLTSHYCK